MLNRSLLSPLHIRKKMSSSSSSSSVPKSVPKSVPTSVPISSLREKIDVDLVKWEEFALCMEEHFHALEMFKRKPNGKPMGYR